MRLSRRQVLVGAAAAAAVPAWLLSRRPEGGPQTGRPGHVILVDWDGFDPDYLGRAPTPNIDALASRGSLSTAESTFTTKSNPARASISTGAYPEVHGNASYYFDERSNEAVGQTRFLAAETISQALAAEGKTTAAVQWHLVRDHGSSYGDPEHLYLEPGGLFEQRVDAAIDILNLRPVDSGGEMVTVPKIPDFLAVYGPDLDAFGHAEGAESPNLGPLLAELDRRSRHDHLVSLADGEACHDDHPRPPPGDRASRTPRSPRGRDASRHGRPGSRYHPARAGGDVPGTAGSPDAPRRVAPDLPGTRRGCS
jgi:hypothetical protein